MAFRCCAVALALLCVFGLFETSDAARIKRRSTTRMTRRSTCPSLSCRSPKGDCINGETNSVITEECCTTCDKCTADLAELLKAWQARLMKYITECDMEPSDWTDDLDGGKIPNSEKLCSAKCQDVADLVTTLPFVDFVHMNETCNCPEHRPSLQQLELFLSFVEPTDVAWAACSAEVTTTIQAEVTTTEKVVTTTEEVVTTTAAATTTTASTGMFNPITGPGNVFIIDFSASMRQCVLPTISSSPYSCTHTRMDMVKDALLDLIGSTPWSFTIVAMTSYRPYDIDKLTLTSHPILSKTFISGWRTGKAAAAAFFDRLREGQGSTDMETPLKWAYGLEGVRSVHLLSDGLPTEKCRSRDCMPIGDVPVHTTLYAPGASDFEIWQGKWFMEWLSKETGGRFKHAQ